MAPLRLRPVTGFRDPGTYDYAAHHARGGIYVVATPRAESVTPLDDPAPPWSVRVKRESVAAIARGRRLRRRCSPGSCSTAVTNH